MKHARQEVRENYNLDIQPDEIVDILVSCGGTWQKRGFSSLYGTVFLLYST